jgi:nitrate reductase (NAD(P)H)
VTRLEVSLDNGDTWKLANIDRKEKPTKYGMYWCWVWWTIKIPILELMTSKELLCRAWDESNNTQSMVPTWNLMGMGNNHVFRVQVHSTPNHQSSIMV